ncbi:MULTISPECIES: hypothetical protein [unclassified Pseudomonas]|uniref:hypothetical protein n=1 Tax=unclassified Pseudomonas TaxID=196821 RepID=UPI0015A4DDD9|nr:MULTISPECIES: hypothetical protein [unclassified Pseudomonas]MDQ0668772.1 sugar phosphate isomerase/epimerase [Pseudomonas sp. W2I6]NWB55626.1 hypothetical protein [Pseudomonas sp. F8002]
MRIALDPYMYRHLPLGQMVDKAAEFTGQSDNPLVCENRFMRSMDELMPEFEGEGIKLEHRPDESNRMMLERVTRELCS